MKKFFVVSLPRTGTKSLCKMAKTCGLTVKHVPGLRYEGSLMGHQFFADTPCFVPSFVEKVCEDNRYDANFIYIQKDHKEIFESWKKVNLYFNYVWLKERYSNEETKSGMSQSMVFDIESYNESFGNIFLNEDNYSQIFENHKNQITEIIKKYNKNLLVYSFSDGWEPFCNFIETTIPESEIPYLNKDTMFEKID